MIMSPWLRKSALTLHVMLSVGVLGAVAAFLILALMGLVSSNDAMVRSVYPAMDVIARLVIVPLAFGSLLSGIVQSLGTTWGLFRHYWVLAKLFLTVFVIVILLHQMGLIGTLADVAAQGLLSTSDYLQARRSLAIHASGGLLALLIPVAFSIFKPRGVTRYGWRKQHKSRL